MRSDVVEAIKSQIDLGELIREVVPLKRVGQNLSGLCPFHHEKTASFTVSPTKGLFYCYGCHVGGDVFKFVQKYYNWDFQQALEELGRRAGVQIEKFRADPLWDEGLKILEVVGQYYQDSLAQKSKAQIFHDYLKQRRIPATSVRDFALGAHLGDHKEVVRLLDAKGFSKDLAQQLGLVGRLPSGEWMDRFRGRLMFPIIDEKGRIRGFGGRTLGQEQPKYINSPKSAVFDKGRLFYGIHLASLPVSKKGYAVLVEGYLDVMALHEFGVSNALGSMGTALTIDQVRLLKRMSTRVISLYDADRAGLAATEKNLGNFLREGVEPKVVMLPTGKDPDAFLHQEGKNPDDLKRDLKKAFEASELALDFLVKHTVLKEVTPLARAKKFRELTRILDEVPDEIERTLLKKDLAKRFDLSEALLIKEDKPAGAAPMGASSRPSRAPQASQDRGMDGLQLQERREEDLMRFLVQYGDKSAFLLTEAVSCLSSNPRWGAPLKFLAERGIPSNEVGRLTWFAEWEAESPDKASEELQQKLNKWAFEEVPLLQEEQLLRLWNDNIMGLKKSHYQGYSRELQNQIAEAEKSSDFDRLRKLLAEKQDLAKVMRTFDVTKGTEIL